MRSSEFITESKSIVLEGGNMFTLAQDFDQGLAPKIVAELDNVLSTIGVSVTPVGSSATPVKGQKSNDFDVMVEENLIAQHFKVKSGAEARKSLHNFLSSLGYQVGQSGVSVHLLLPVGKKHIQVDIMVVPNANMISRFHIHRRPENSPYKGVHKQILISAIAKLKNMLWSPFQGLFERATNGKRGDLISNDLDEIAKILISPSATADDLASVEAIFAKIPESQRNIILSQLATDPNWQAKAQ